MRKARIAGLAALVVSIASGLPLAATAQAATTDLYVDGKAGCSDSSAAAGSQGVPFCTVSAAAKVVEPGQTVHIAPGAYPEQVKLTRSGEPGAPITFVGPAGGPQSSAQVVADGPHALELSGVHDVDIAQLTLKSQQEALLVTDSSQVTADRIAMGPATSSDSPSVRVGGGSSDVTVSRSTLHVGGRGIAVDPGAKHTVITTNSLWLNNDAITATDAPGTVVTSNSIDQICGAGIVLQGDSAGSTIENNALYDYGSPLGGCESRPGGKGVSLSVSAGSVPGTKADYNALPPSWPTPYSWDGTSYATATAFRTGSGQGAYDDLSDMGGSWGLYEGVPQIDSADADAPGELTTDLDGNPRVDDPLTVNSGTGVGYHDRGAYEHQEYLQAFVSTEQPTDGSSPLERSIKVDMVEQYRQPLWGTPKITVDFGDGTQESPATFPVRHVYEKAGTYLITATATGQYGRTKTATTSVTVYSGPILPALTIAHDWSTKSPHAYQMDPFSTVSPWPTAQRQFDYGDGSAVTGNRVHQYHAAGSYPVTMTVTDIKGNTGKITKILNDGMAYRGGTPTRVLDTRDGTGARKGVVGPGEMIRIAAPVDLVRGAGAAVLNVTATGPTADGFVTAYQGGTNRPNVSSLNFKAGQTVSNQVVVPVDPNGTISLYNRNGNVQLVADLVGFYAYDYQYLNIDYQGVADPTRALDTRTGTGAPAGKVGPNGTVKFKVAGLGNVPDNAYDVILNVTATEPTAASYVTAGPDRTPPSFSSLNFAAGQTVSNQVIARIDQQGYVTLYNFKGDVHLIADIQGFHGGTGADRTFIPAAPTRLLDTRNGTGPLHADTALRLKVAGSAGIPEGVKTLLVNLTATNPTADGFLTAYAAGATRPGTSIVNFTAGATVPNLAYIPVSADGYIEIYNRNGTTDAIVDVQGYLS